MNTATLLPFPRWDDTRAATLDEPNLLLYRSNLLGSDLRITNYGGGNTSAKLLQTDALTATHLLKAAFQTDVTALLQQVRLDAGGAIDPVGAYRASGYRRRAAEERPAVLGGGGGIV